jgi:predicted metal-binding membrane protein
VNDRSLTERLLQRDRIALVAIIGLLFALAGLYTVFGVGMRMSALDMTAMRGMRDMPGPGIAGQWSPGYALLVFLMWWVMMIAMMLPSVSPTVLLYAAILRRGQKPDRVPAISTAFVAGYLVAWAGFSVIAASVQWFLEAQGVVSATMMTLTDTVPGALVLIAAGIFQFTPLKQTCLRHCRSPVEFITQHRRPGVSGAFVMGLAHGVYCLGCCWFLMALLFVGGIMNLFWIVGLAAFVALEKLTPYGEALSKIAGVVLIGWGAYVIYSSL